MYSKCLLKTEIVHALPYMLTLNWKEQSLKKYRQVIFYFNKNCILLCMLCANKYKAWIIPVKVFLNIIKIKRDGFTANLFFKKFF